MYLTVLSPCVDYADFLGRSIELWHRGADEFVVVTHARDEQTVELCRTHGIRTHITERFFIAGAEFNKAGALADAFASLEKVSIRNRWWLLIDADVQPPNDWRKLIESEILSPGNIYGARRRSEDGKPIPDATVVGFFMLFSDSDPHARKENGRIFDDWHNAGSYDSEFVSRWPPDRRIILQNMSLVHFGQTGRNWCGRGKDAEMRRMVAERIRRGGWRHENLSSVA